jgi:hypothetical protein
MKSWQLTVWRNKEKVHSVNLRHGTLLWAHAEAQLDGKPTDDAVVESATNLVMEAFAADESSSVEVEV